MALVFLCLMMYNKNYFYKLRRPSEKLFAEVVEYRWEKGPMRNDYTKLCYPYVRISGKEESSLVKLSYANNHSEPFKIGEVVEVFWHEKTLLYYHACETGFMKFIPAFKKE
ncbi:hypothetical protein [Rufibacter hautae]|uniref:DUF3592 domain-containing protein n=1 Tax=Rufibacter hautae TaxID=2595005 RepID=A0A5B6TID2_9BACT|nr:hypothetical protein [Rufibacter hautae]KAA3439207.1 hypothetical protein FOA19_00535 [Rufibacter hautae]